MAAHLAERLHLHGADERHKHIGRHVPLLRQKADGKEQHDLREDDELPPVDLFHALKAPVDALSDEYSEREREHRHEIAHGARRVALKKIGAQKDDVAGLSVGKHLAAAEIGIGVLQTAGENDERSRQQRVRHLTACGAMGGWHMFRPEFQVEYIILCHTPPFFARAPQRK